jgi:hypothetical protein
VRQTCPHGITRQQRNNTITALQFQPHHLPSPPLKDKCRVIVSDVLYPSFAVGGNEKLLQIGTGASVISLEVVRGCMLLSIELDGTKEHSLESTISVKSCFQMGPVFSVQPFCYVRRQCLRELRRCCEEKAIRRRTLREGPCAFASRYAV